MRGGHDDYINALALAAAHATVYDQQVAIACIRTNEPNYPRNYQELEGEDYRQALIAKYTTRKDDWQLKFYK